MALGIGVVAILVVAIFTLAVAVLVLFLDFNQRVHRAFALFLVLRAMMDGMLIISEAAGPGERVRMYWFIAVPFAALHFCLAYRRRHGRRADSSSAWAAPWVILAAALSFEVLYFLDHALFAGPPTFGPFHWFSTVRLLAFASVAWVFAAEIRHTTQRSGRRALLLASVGFALNPLYFCTFEVGVRLSNGSFGWTVDDAILLLSLAFLADTFRRLLSLPTNRMRVVITVTLFAWLALAGTTVALFQATGGDIKAANLLRVLNALSALAVPVCITYALVKHRLFDSEVKLRFAIKGSTIAAAFIAVFFVVSEGAQQFFGEQAENQYYGIVAAGLLVFALAPLQRVADRLASRAVPAGKLARGTHAEHLQLYQEQLEIAWADGRLTAKERLLFARLQERLGISAEEAVRMESDLLATVSKARSRRATPA